MSMVLGLNIPKLCFLEYYMDKVTVSDVVVKKLVRHALRSFPNECVGIFECIFDGKKYEITDAYECKNMAANKRYGSLLAKKDFRYFNKKRMLMERRNVFYGVYHSHPLTGSLQLSDMDKNSARFYKMFKMQLILGVQGKKLVRKRFWKKKGNTWHKANLIKIEHGH